MLCPYQLQSFMKLIRVVLTTKNRTVGQTDGQNSNLHTCEAI